MFLIAGLGNPGNKYEATRHNIGFEVIDYLASLYNIKVNKLKYKGLFGEGVIAEEKVILVKPQTFMNSSGECIRDIVNFYKIPVEQVVVIYDDISIDTAKMRIRVKGSDGGHNGMKSIIYQLNSDNFPRIRIGIGSPPHPDYDLADYVLSRFAKDEIKLLEETIKQSAEAISVMIKSGVEMSMNKFNRK